jgi:hypothetical protein
VAALSGTGLGSSAPRAAAGCRVRSAMKADREPAMTLTVGSGTVTLSRPTVDAASRVPRGSHPLSRAWKEHRTWRVRRAVRQR